MCSASKFDLKSAILISLNKHINKNYNINFKEKIVIENNYKVNL